jgi:hypothetical protein
MSWTKSVRKRRAGARCAAGLGGGVAAPGHASVSNAIQTLWQPCRYWPIRSMVRVPVARQYGRLTSYLSDHSAKGCGVLENILMLGWHCNMARRQEEDHQHGIRLPMSTTIVLRGICRHHGNGGGLLRDEAERQAFALMVERSGNMTRFDTKERICSS